MKEWSSESELALKTCEWLESVGWETYKEVVSGTGTIDIVAKLSSDLWAIETKLSLSNSVLRQAYDRLMEAPMVSIAVPGQRSLNIAIDHFLRYHGIGLLYISKHGVKEEIMPKRVRPRNSKVFKRFTRTLKNSLHEDQKNCIPGSGSGEAITPYKRTMKKVRELMSDNRKRTIKEILYKLDGSWHWASNSSARGGLLRALTEFEKGYQWELKGKEYVFSLKGNKNG